MGNIWWLDNDGWLASGQPGQMVTRPSSHRSPSYFLIRNPTIIIIIWNKTLWGLMLFLAFTSELLSSKALVEQQMIAPYDHQSPPPSPLMIPQAKQEWGDKGYFWAKPNVAGEQESFWMIVRSPDQWPFMYELVKSCTRSRWMWWWEQLALIDTKQPNLAAEPVN